ELAPRVSERRITGCRGVGLDTIPGYAACQGCLQEREERVCHFLERKIRAGVRSEAHPSVGERAGRSFQQGPDLWFNAAVWIVEPSRDTVLPECPTAGGRELQPPGRMIPTIGTSQELESKLQVCNAAGHWTSNGQVGLGQGPGRSGNLSMRRHDAVTRLMPNDARHMGRQTNGAADVTTEFQRGKAARQSRGRAAG